MRGKENKELNKAIIILIKSGFSKSAASRLLKIDRRNLCRVWRRDKDKYNINNITQLNATAEAN